MSTFLRRNNPFKETKILTFSNLILLGAASVNQDEYYSNDSWGTIGVALLLATTRDSLKCLKSHLLLFTDRDVDAVLYHLVKSRVIFLLTHRSLVNAELIQLRRKKRYRE